MVFVIKSLNKIQIIQNKKGIEEFNFIIFEISKELWGQLNKRIFIYSTFLLNKSQITYSSDKISNDK